jgi:hypothetical protein
MLILAVGDLIHQIEYTKSGDKISSEYLTET